GETFRPAYLELGRVLERLDPPATSAFTATASPTVFEAVASRLFGGRDYRVIEGDPDRPNLSYAVLPTLSRQHSLERLARELPKPLIVFCSSREGAQIIAEMLRARLGTTEARFYHAGLEKAEKKAVETWFLASETGILAATCAYGMGVDKKNIRSIVHYETPSAVEAYLQEAGRAGRDGKPARAVLLVGTDEETRHGGESDPGRRARRAAFLGYAAAREGCRREALLGLLGSPLRGACSGCDRCEGAATDDFEGAGEIAGFVGANPRRFEEGRALALLRGEAGTEPPCCAGSGRMKDWRREDLAAALRCMEEQGRLRRPTRGPYRKRLAPPARPARPKRRSLESLAFFRGDRLGSLFRGLGLGRASPDGHGRPGLPVHETHVAEQGPGQKDEDGGRDDAPVLEDGQGKLDVLAEGHGGQAPARGPRGPAAP
ncbi:MAG: ATP-dependent DNA helicase RecQ, partial [Spirochaetaceae bacterium]|nr:ATP-dependent DNA helicase RecQ [Spirochaetaceae bacterium]